MDLNASIHVAGEEDVRVMYSPPRSTDPPNPLELPPSLHLLVDDMQLHLWGRPEVVIELLSRALGMCQDELALQVKVAS